MQKKLILCAGKNEIFSFATSVGVGMIEPCITLSQLILAKKPETIIFIGSCGLYDKQKELLKIYESRHAFNIEFSKLENGFYSPANCEVDLENSSKENLNINDKNTSNERAKKGEKFENLSQNFALEKTNLCEKSQEVEKQKSKVSQETFLSNSSNYICANSKAAAKFQALRLDLENMEIFSVLSVARHFDIEATCFLCASNYCDEKAHEVFLKNHCAVKKNLENFLQEQNHI